MTLRGAPRCPDRRANGRRGILAAALLALVLGATVGCSGVPGHSAPQAVRTVGLGNGASTAADIGPVPGAEPRDIVQGFLSASAESADARHSGARQFLTPDAAAKWQDSTVTIVDDVPSLDVAQTTRDSATVNFSYQRRGQLDARGIFSPEKNNAGVGERTTVTYTLRRSNGAWRISELPAGLGVVITELDFGTRYPSRPLYFFDSTESVLVPDLRYSALSGQALATWLLGQMLGSGGTGPRPDLIGSVQTEIPDGTDPTRAAVSYADPMVVEIPGSSQLDSSAQSRLAAELAYTIGPIRFAGLVSLSDGGKVVDVPNVGTVFSTSNFPDVGVENTATSSPPFYLRSGALIDGATKPVPGTVGSGTYGLTAVALHQGPSGVRMVAGLSTAGLLTGPVAGPLVRVPVGRPVTALSRPEFDPRTGDVWIGVGAQLYRVRPDRTWTAVPIPAPTGGGLPARGQIQALRFSPDGVRLAVVFGTGDGSSRALWIGSVSRSSEAVSVGNFEAVTPTALRVRDVAWQDARSLLTVAAVGAGESQIYSIQSDGSGLTALSRFGLPPGLVSVAASVGEPPLVSTQGTVWVQAGSGWRPLAGGGQTEGYAPAYVQ